LRLPGLNPAAQGRARGQAARPALKAKFTQQRAPWPSTSLTGGGATRPSGPAPGMWVKAPGTAGAGTPSGLPVRSRSSHRARVFPSSARASSQPWPPSADGPGVPAAGTARAAMFSEGRSISACVRSGPGRVFCLAVRDRRARRACRARRRSSACAIMPLARSAASCCSITGCMVSSWAHCARPLRGRTVSASGGVASGTSAIWPMSPRGGALHDGAVEIRIVLDQAEPPAGRLRVVLAAGQDHRPAAAGEIRFTGWLGLLKALYEVTGSAGPSPPGGA
jgi:hypothetical protein